MAALPVTSFASEVSVIKHIRCKLRLTATALHLHGRVSNRIQMNVSICVQKPELVVVCIAKTRRQLLSRPQQLSSVFQEVQSLK